MRELAAMGLVLATLLGAAAPGAADSVEVQAGPHGAEAPLPPGAAAAEGSYGFDPSAAPSLGLPSLSAVGAAEERPGVFVLRQGPVAVAVLLPWKGEYGAGEHRIVLDPAHPVAAALDGHVGVVVAHGGAFPAQLAVTDQGVSARVPGSGALLLPWMATPHAPPVRVAVQAPATPASEVGGAQAWALPRAAAGAASEQACAPASGAHCNPPVDEALAPLQPSGDGCEQGHIPNDPEAWTSCLRWSLVARTLCKVARLPALPGGLPPLGLHLPPHGTCWVEHWQVDDDHLIPLGPLTGAALAAWESTAPEDGPLWGAFLGALPDPPSLEASPQPPVQRTEVVVQGPSAAPGPPSAAPWEGSVDAPGAGGVVPATALHVRAEPVLVHVHGGAPGHVGALGSGSAPARRPAAAEPLPGASGLGGAAPGTLAPAWMVHDPSGGALPPPAPAPEGALQAASVAVGAERIGAGLDVVRATLVAAALAVPLWALYHRLRAADALAQARRKQVYEAIAAQPGASVGELRALTGLHYTTCQHHVRKLAIAGHVVVRASGGRVRCYPNHARYGLLEERLLAAARSATAAALLRLALERPGIGAGAAAQALGIAPATLTYHLRRLEEGGLLEVGRSGRRARLRVAPPAAALAAATLAAPQASATPARSP